MAEIWYFYVGSAKERKEFPTLEMANKEKLKFIANGELCSLIMCQPSLLS